MDTDIQKDLLMSCDDNGVIIQMGMTGVEPAYHGLKARCIAVLLHTRMSHAGFEPTLEDQKSPVLSYQTNETQRSSELNRYSRIQSPACSNSSEADVLHTDRKCTDGFEPSRMVLQTTLTTRSCAQRWTVFELNELLRIFSPPLLPSQLTVLFCRITPAV